MVKAGYITQGDLDIRRRAYRKWICRLQPYCNKYEFVMITIPEGGFFFEYYHRKHIGI